MRHLSLVALVAVAGLATPSGQGKLAGDWALTFNTPNGVIDAAASFAVDGEKLSGTIRGQAGETAFTGTVKGSSFTLSFDVQTAQGTISITMQGEQEGDALKGTFDFGQGMGDWTGKRK